MLRGGVWLYASSMINNLTGYFYWLIISSITGPETIGIVSAIAGLSILVTGILSLGTNMGVQRFLGKAIGKNRRDELSTYFWSSLILTTIVFGIASSVLLVLGLYGYSIINLSPSMLIFSAVLTLAAINLIPISLLQSLLRTDLMFIMSLIGGTLRIATGLTLVFMGWGWVGAAIGYLCPALVNLIVGMLFSLKNVIPKPTISLSAIQDILKAGVARWLPTTITLIGYRLGVLMVFAYIGATETGLYYIASAIAGAITMVSMSTIALLLPFLSSLQNGRKRACFRVLKLCLALILPPSVFVIVYPQFILSLLGSEYVVASPILFTLLLAIVPDIIVGAVGNLVYAYGYYILVLLIGLAANIPRVVLYYPLVMKYGGWGTALSSVTGSFIGLIMALVVARRIGFKLEWRLLGKILILPITTGTLLWLLRLDWWIGIFILLANYLLYLKLRILTKSDIIEIASVLKLEPLLKSVYDKYGGIVDKLVG
ncbi:MAG: hypothetical protein DRN53_00385 [Thermoprotei archaeon]|nr:MAG: hypothetical protein DRN53_00385 [Thermoprotei archaeon]